MENKIVKFTIAAMMLLYSCVTGYRTSGNAGIDSLSRAYQKQNAYVVSVFLEAYNKNDPGDITVLLRIENFSKGQNIKLSNITFTVQDVRANATLSALNNVELVTQLNNSTQAHRGLVPDSVLTKGKAIELADECDYNFRYHFKDINNANYPHKLLVNLQANVERSGKKEALKKTKTFRWKTWVNLGMN